MFGSMISPGTAVRQLKIEKVVLCVSSNWDYSSASSYSFAFDAEHRTQGAIVTALTGKAGRYVVVLAAERAGTRSRSPNLEKQSKKLERDLRRLMTRKLDMQGKKQLDARKMESKMRVVTMEQYVQELDDDVLHAMGKWAEM